jgi:transposase
LRRSWLVNYLLLQSQQKEILMANQLKMAKIDAILALHQRNWSIRRIAKELGLHRGAVARHIQLAEATPKSARAPLGSTEELTVCPDSKPATAEGALIGSAAPPLNKQRQASLCEPWRQVILDKLEAGLTAQRIYQDLVREHGFTAKYHSVRRFVRRLGEGRPFPFRRMECAPGEEAQVDFGRGIPFVPLSGARFFPSSLRSGWRCACAVVERSSCRLRLPSSTWTVRGAARIVGFLNVASFPALRASATGKPALQCCNAGSMPRGAC